MAIASETQTSTVEGARRRHLERIIEEARQRLIQTDTRNRLVHCARGSKRGKYVDIVDERSDEIFRILVRQSRRMRFKYDDKADEEVDPDEPILSLEAEGVADDGRYTDLFLQTPLGEDKLQKKLLGIARDARTLEEEQGINALYLALGFLRWFEDENSEKLREAPLILIPVNLRRNVSTSMHELVARGDDILTNEPLKRRLEGDFAITLPEIPEDEEWKPSDYFSDVSLAISGKSRWSVDADGMQLGFFSFAKLLMVKDLEPENWPDGELLESDLIKALLVEGFADEGVDFPPDAKLDEIFAPADLIQVVDADASQTLVIEAVRRGRNLVVQGPPGTGKSQTITNIISAAVHDGKRVLFMAEKMAALNVVHQRLKKAGLQALCLELHSRQANKKDVLTELDRTIRSASAVPGVEDEANALRELRDQLNAWDSVMHTEIGSSGTTPYRAISTLISLTEEGFQPVELTLPDLSSWTMEQLRSALDAVRTLAAITKTAGHLNDHPFFGVRRPNLIPPDVARLRQKIEALLPIIEKTDRLGTKLYANLQPTQITSVSAAQSLSAVLTHIVSLPTACHAFVKPIISSDSPERVVAICSTARRCCQTMNEYASSFNKVALTIPVAHLRTPLASGATFLGRLRSAYRKASTELAGLLNGELPKTAAERLNLVDQLIGLQEAHREFAGLDEDARTILGPHWHGVDSDFDGIETAANWLAQLRELMPEIRTSSAADFLKVEPEKMERASANIASWAQHIDAEFSSIRKLIDVDIPAVFNFEKITDIPFQALSTRLSTWVNNLDRLDEWSRLQVADATLRSLEFADLADRMADGSLDPNEAAGVLRYAHAEALYRKFVADYPSLPQLTAAHRQQLIGEFRSREQARFKSTGHLVSAEHLASVPRGGMGAMGIIRGEIAKRRNIKPIRWLVNHTGQVLQQIKPVFLMSPISVAQFLKPGSVEFDLLVIDEASQVRPEDAIGAVARSRQIVVVGDSKQLPPTSFFDRMMSDASNDDEPDEEDQIAAPIVTGPAEMESVLKLCEARGLSSRMLRWHYRSKHPSLIEVSNEEFYDGDLVLPPAPTAGKRKYGLFVHRIQGAYERGGKRVNRIEAGAVVNAVRAHAREIPAQSLGVVTFSTSQRDLINELLELARREDEALDVFLREGQSEDFFVKNLENVQGDERDVIMISVGYGPRIAGQRLDSMAFGPVSTDGGERRLNVLFTRARYRTEVFVSFAAGDINLERTKMAGPRVLKRFLQFGETGVLETAGPTGEDPDSEFEEAVAKVIRGLGFKVDYQVGSAGFRIDLAVRHPDAHGRYMLAVECDGATYHSALWARERDRMRQDVLESLGWRFHRIWSTDWFHRRSEELRRLEAALTAAKQASELTPADANSGAENSNLDDDAEDQEDLVKDLGNGELVAPESSLPPYEVADFANWHKEEPHEVPLGKMAFVVQKIIDIEGPVHEEEIARRVASLFGKQRTGKRIAEHTFAALRLLTQREPNYQSEDGFWFTVDQAANPPLRNRSEALLSLRRADMIPPMEIAAAIKQVLTENGAIVEADIPRAVALLFGFLRTGPEFKPAVEPVVERSMACGEIVEGPAGLTLA